MCPYTSIDPAVIQRVPLFRALDERQASQVSALLKKRRYRKGEIIFHQGDPSDCLYIIGAGQVRIYLTNPDGREITLRIYESASAFGELALLDGKPRSASAAALEDTTTFMLYREDFLGKLWQHVALMQQMLALIAERVRYTTSFSEQLAFLSVPGRVAAVLAQLAAAGCEEHGAVRLALTQQELASFVNTTRESISHALHDLADRGLIRVERRSVVVLDRERLQSTY
jgi:CRP/FNR family transcriptional regulator, cyclic AMP receptor protein